MYKLPTQDFMEEKMLVLTRKLNQRIRIGDSIELVLLEVRGGRARIGIECPKAIPVRRTELFQTGVMSENGQATTCIMS